MALPNIFMQAGITPEVDLDDLDEVRPPRKSSAPVAAARKLRISPFDLKGATPPMGGVPRGFPTPGEVVSAAFPGAGGTLPPPTSPDDPLVKSGVYPEQALAPAAPRDPSRYQKTTRPKQDPMVGGRDDKPAQVSAPHVAARGVGTGGNKWGPVIDETVARQAEGLRSASDQMSETYAQDAQVRDQLAALQGGLVAPAFDEKERAAKRAKKSAERLDQASKLYLDQVYQGLDPDRVFGPGRLNRATVLAASIGNGNQLYSTGVAAPDMLGLIERVVDRDLDLQQAEIDNRGQAANSLLAQLQVALGDKDMAADAFRLTWLDMIKSEMEAMVPRIADAQQRAAMVEKIGGLDQYRTEAQAKLEEAYLGRNLDAQKTNAGNALEAEKANASNAIAAAKASRSMNDKDAAGIDEFHKRWGTALTSIRGGRRLASLMRESLAKFGKVPGMGNLFLSKTIDEARKYYEQLRSGAMQLGSPDETRAALDIAQAALEWQQKKFKSAKDGGAQSDWDTSLMQEVYGLLKNKDVNSVFNILGNDEHDVGDEYVVALRQAFPGDERKHVRRYVMENNLPEWLTPDEREGAPSPTRKPEYPGQINLR